MTSVDRRPLRAAFVTGSVSRRAGGMFTSIRRMGQAISERGVDVQVLGLADQDTAADLDAWAPLKPLVSDTFPPRAFGYAPQLPGRLAQLDADLVHVQGLWMYPSLANLRWCTKAARPYLISPRGMLDSWALSNSRWKKKIVGWSFENRHLAGAQCLHALCESERQSLRTYGLSNPVCVIPNGVDLDDSPGVPLPERIASVTANRRVLLFIGRIHPKKGLSQLISAWDQLRQSDPGLIEDWVVIIAGWDQGGHSGELNQMICDKRLKSDIHLVGPLFGPDKTAILRAANAFVLPSKSEGLPMAVLEAWAQRLPTAITRECNLPEGVAHGAAVKLGTDASGIRRGLADLLAFTDAERMEMGARGRKLVEDHFNWNSVASQFVETYRWVLGGGAAPECIGGD